MAIAVAGVVALFFAVGPSEANILASVSKWKVAVAEHLIVAVLVFLVAEVVLVGFSVPVATALSILAGVLFGRWLGTLVVSFASTYGALVAMLLARYVIGDSVRRRLAGRPRWQTAQASIDRGVERDGWFFLLLVRLTPVLPFFLINLGMGLTRIRWWTYTWVTQLGMLPSTFIVVSAGAEAGDVSSFRELASLERFWPLMVLVLLAVALRILAASYLRRHPA